MNPLIVDGVFGAAKSVIDRIWPDPAQQAEAERKIAELKQSGDLSWLDANVQVMMGQIETNKIEAQHGGLFKGGWRPAVGWICAFSLAYTFIIYPFLIFAIQVITHFLPEVSIMPIEILPVIEWSELSVILLGMLGLGGMRTYEKHGTRKSHNK